MKFFQIFFTVLWALTSALPVWAKAESQPETKTSESKPSAAFRAKSTMEEALALMQIYGKIRKIIGKEDRSELKGQLDQLNSALDEILAFKSSFTPKKLEKVEKQLNHLKSCITDISSANLDQLKNQSSKLLGSLMNLITAIMEPGPDENQNTL